MNEIAALKETVQDSDRRQGKQIDELREAVTKLGRLVAQMAQSQSAVATDLQQASNRTGALEQTVQLLQDGIDGVKARISTLEGRANE